MKTPTILPTLPKWGEKRLIKLIEFLEKLPRKKFNFAEVVSDGKQNGHFCATVACACGWLPAVLPRLVKWTGATELNEGYCEPKLMVNGVKMRMPKVNAFVFGMDEEQGNYLFSPSKQGYVDSRLPSCARDATPKQVARMLRKYLKLTHTPQ